MFHDCNGFCLYIANGDFPFHLGKLVSSSNLMIGRETWEGNKETPARQAQSEILKMKSNIPIWQDLTLESKTVTTRTDISAIARPNYLCHVRFSHYGRETNGRQIIRSTLSLDQKLQSLYRRLFHGDFVWLHWPKCKNSLKVIFTQKQMVISIYTIASHIVIE